MRFLPRFSLRALWIVLTIFLIAFGVAVKYWRDIYEHERVANKLAAFGGEIDEEYDTLHGHVIAKRIVGMWVHVNFQLDAKTNRDSKYDEVLQTLRELPNKSALRKLTFSLASVGSFDPETNPPLPQTKEMLNLLKQFPALEVLDLQLLILEPGDLQPLSELQELRALNFLATKIPQRELRPVLERLPKLERLQLNCLGDDDDRLQLAEVLSAQLPELRQLFFGYSDQIACLELTKQAIGRFPKLEFLGLPRVTCERVTLEAGALPHLRTLDLSGVQKTSPIDWQLLPAAAPNLNAFAVHCTQVTNQAVTAFTQLPKLQQLHIAGLDKWDIRDMHTKRPPEHLHPDYFPFENLDDLLTRCGQLQFPLDEYKFLAVTREQTFGIDFPSWKAQQPRPKNSE